METFRGAIQSFKSRGQGPTRDKLQPQYDAVPQWWYMAAAFVALGIGIFTYEFYPVQLRWYGVIFAMVVSSVFFVPVSEPDFCRKPSVTNVSKLAWVYATSNIKIQIDIFCRIIAGYVWEGKVLANIWFFNVGYISGIKGLAFAQDLKLGIYCGVSTYVFRLLRLSLTNDRSPQEAYSLFNLWALSWVPWVKSRC